MKCQFGLQIILKKEYAIKNYMQLWADVKCYEQFCKI